jgi:hypothetical protein
LLNQSTKPAGKIVMVAAVPGAVILSSETGETIAIDQSQVEKVIGDMKDLVLFAKQTIRYEDDLIIPGSPVIL